MAAAAGLKQIGVYLSIAWFVEEVVQRIQVMMMIAQRAQQMQRREQALGDKDPFKDVRVIVSPTKERGKYNVTVKLRLDMPLNPDPFSCFWIYKDILVCGLPPPAKMESANDTSSLQVVTEINTGARITFPAKDVLAPKEVSFVSERFTRFAVWLDQAYRCLVAPPGIKLPYWEKSCPACTKKLGETRCDWAQYGVDGNYMIYHRVHGEEFAVSSAVFDEADIAFFAGRIAELQADLNAFKTELDMLKEAAEFIENQWFRDDYPTWLLQEKFSEFAKAREEAKRKLENWRRIFDDIAGEIEKLMPEEAAKLRAKWKEVPLPDINQLLVTFPRVQLEERIKKEEKTLSELKAKLESKRAELRSLTATYASKIWDAAADEIKALASAYKTGDPQLIAAKRAAAIAKVRGILEEYKSRRASVLAEIQKLSQQTDSQDKWIKWLKGEIRTPTPPVTGVTSA